MAKETEIFIETVSKYAYLFDRSHEYYKNSSKRTEAWNQIAQELDMTSKFIISF